MNDDLKINLLGNVYGDYGTSYGGAVWDKNNIAPTLKTTSAASQQCVIVKTNGLKPCKLLGGMGEMKSNNGRQYYQQDRVYKMGDIALSLCANIPGGSYKYLDER